MPQSRKGGMFVKKKTPRRQRGSKAERVEAAKENAATGKAPLSAAQQMVAWWMAGCVCVCVSVH